LKLQLSAKKAATIDWNSKATPTVYGVWNEKMQQMLNKGFKKDDPTDATTQLSYFGMAGFDQD